LPQRRRHNLVADPPPFLRRLWLTLHDRAATTIWMPRVEDDVGEPVRIAVAP
jgi:hypothetical protein